ncbi:MAG: hydrogenase nickel incorporation protein HypB [Candidatus Goldiibacteriota bacterium]
MAEVKVFKSIMERNDTAAMKNRKLMNGALCLNIMSSPGAGKTTLLEKMLMAARKKIKTAVIEGDVATSNDAERIKKYTAPGAVYQIKTENFGGGCHLDAKMITNALRKVGLPRKKYDLIIIENIGNLICPAGFFLGEDKKVVIISVTEGDDKPLKYPGMFREADLVIINKVDLLKHVKFSMRKVKENIKKINSRTDVLSLTATRMQDVKQFTAWVEKQRQNTAG